MWNVVDRERAHSFHEQSRILNEISGSHPGEMAVFWDVATCNLVEIDRRFRDVSCDIRGITLTMKSVRSLKRQLIYTRLRFAIIPEDSHIYTCLRDNLKSYLHLGLLEFLKSLTSSFKFPL